jgi:hypothetical protein
MPCIIAWREFTGCNSGMGNPGKALKICSAGGGWGERRNKAGKEAGISRTENLRKVICMNGEVELCLRFPVY